MYTCTIIGSPCSDACTLCIVHYTSNTSYAVTCFVMKNRAQGGMTISVSYMGHCTELSLTCSSVSLPLSSTAASMPPTPVAHTSSVMSLLQSSVTRGGSPFSRASSQPLRRSVIHTCTHAQCHTMYIYTCTMYNHTLSSTCTCTCIYGH